MLTMQSPVQGKYGFYACDYETFRELKAYHGLLLRAYRQFRAYQRWAAHKGSNRYRQERQPRHLGGLPIGERVPAPRPPYPESVTETVKGWSYGWGGEGDGTYGVVREWPEFRRFNGRNLYLHVLGEYRKARRPYQTAETVPTLDALPGDWRDQLAALRAHDGVA